MSDDVILLQAGLDRAVTFLCRMGDIFDAHVEAIIAHEGKLPPGMLRANVAFTSAMMKLAAEMGGDKLLAERAAALGFPKKK